MAAIGDLVANLRANAAPMMAGLDAARGGIGRFASFAKSAMAPIRGAFENAFTVSGMLRAAGEQGRAEKMLASQVAATGGAAGLSTQQMVDYARSLQGVTSFSATATEGAMSLMTTFRNVKGDQFKEGIRQAQNLSTVLGTDLNSAAHMVGKALNDPVNSLKMLRKAGIQFSDSQQQQIASMQAAGDMAGAQQVILSGLQASFGGAAENMASPMAMLHNTINDLSASLGSILGPAIKVIAQTLNEMLMPLEQARGSLQALGKLIAQFIGAIFKPFGAAIAQTAQLLMGMFAGGSVSAEDFGNVAQLAMNNMTLGMMKILPNGEQIFTNLGVTINAVWEGLAAGASAAWDDIKSSFSSLANFVMSRAKALWEAVKAGLHGEDPMAAYNRTVEEALKNQIPPTAYKGPIDAFWSSFNKASADATQGLAEQGGLKNVLGSQADDLRAKVKAKIDSLKGLLPDAKMPEFKNQKPGDSGAFGAKKSKATKAEKEEKLEAFEANSKEALQSLAEAARGSGGDDPNERVAEHTAEMKDTLQEIKSIVAKPGDTFDPH